ncbi:MAG: NAD-dependent protein deacetylase [Lachnospiraceae bacterium]|jgi:NAD-dependent SIR2 family protein deacetylase|nr:NAD-dependent protein deacetylase [Lachnospiraceae bacterium]MDD3616634.1 NAD-dependent protein deacetylase [Lachnospiraceae bacterium]
MSLYENLVTQTQMNYSRYYSLYAAGKTPYELSKKEPLPYKEQIQNFAQQVKDAQCIIVGGASGLSAAGGGDFYYEDNASYRKYFGKFAEKYGFNGAFAGMMHQFDTREEHWGYLATFLHTTQTAEARKPYLDLDAIIKGKDFHILTTNQDTQFMKLYEEEQVSEIQGDHRFFQCSKQCCDETWDAVKPVEEMIAAMGEGTKVPSELIPRCPHCGAEMFPWVRGYGNFLQGTKYDRQYQKISDYVQTHGKEKMLLIELGVGRMTPMFIQEPFWNLTLSLPDVYYIGVNDKYAFLPQQIEDKGMIMVSNIADVLADVRKEIESEKTDYSRKTVTMGK